MNNFEKKINENNIYLRNQDQLILAEILSKIDDSKLDYNHSTAYMNNDLIIISIFSINNICCPITVHFGIDSNLNQFNFFFGEAMIIETIIETEKTLKEVIQLLKILLSCNIHEQLVFTDNKVVKSKYYFECKCCDKDFKRIYTGLNKIVLFRRKQKISNRYQAWSE